MVIRALVLLTGWLLLCGVVSPVAAAEPDPGAVAAEPADDGLVESPPPATTDTPDGATLTLSAKDETQRNVPPLTTALSSREYVVGGTWNGELSGPQSDQPPHGVLEVGYQIGCGIDMSTSQGVTLAGTAGITSSVGLAGIDVASPGLDGLLPVVSTPVSGSIALGLKPGIVNIVSVSKKEFTGAAPWVKLTGFRVKIDGCVGESFIRSYSFLTRSTPEGDAILAYYGTTKKV
ncbi:MspA family porin [Mycobacterium sp. MYCO198283]|uniref:MspA family porin n=1 Tax=Mycobacterium sp. MYCO198283 TaxID=2883505 RepID=UPI001E61B6E6|nr:MspA family porin [Mycobacterium sp. MYCO198283]MCG5433286.1 MspA family porin [Mycobacterium sp. MYCO198283]